MLARLHQWLVVASMVILIGGHWALLQSAAWMSMIYNYSSRATVAEAVEKTFSGKFPCQLCKIVQTGKAAEKKQDLEKYDTKLDFSFIIGSAWLLQPRPERQFSPVDSFSRARSQAPLTPPPRWA